MHPDALALLTAAHDARLAQVGGRAVILEAVVEIAARHGYMGTVSEASRFLQAAGYEVEIRRDGRVVVWLNDLSQSEEEKGGQVQFAGTARRVLRTNWT